MATVVDVATLTSDIEEILDRLASEGRAVTVERDGVPVAILSPIKPKIGATAEEIRTKLAGLRMPDPDFADDLEQIQAAGNRERFPAWSSW